MAVMEVDGLSSVLKIFQNRQPFEVSMATANEHIDDSTGKLMIYVPKERRAQELCFGSVLPRKLAAWLMRPVKSLIDGPVEIDAVNALTAIFASERSVLDDILDDQGVLQVSFENKDEGSDGEEEEQEQQSSDNHLETDDTSSEQSTPTNSSVNESTSPYVGRAAPEGSVTETLAETISQRSHMSYRPASEGVRHSPQPALFRHSSQSPDHSGYQAPSNLLPAMAAQSGQRSSEDARYRIILDNAIEKARRAAFPSRGSFNMSDMRNALPSRGDDTAAYESFDGLEVMGRFRSTNQLERDKKVGAAGELYVSDFTCKLRVCETN